MVNDKENTNEEKKSKNESATPNPEENTTQSKKAKRIKADKAPKVGNAQKTVEFPVESRINNYGFIFMRKQWLTALGWGKDAPLRIEKNPDGSITINKA